MSGLEILGLAASVIQIADIGAKLSVRLFTFTRKVKDANAHVRSLSSDIAATGAALRELGVLLEHDKFTDIASRRAIDTVEQLLDDCRQVFEDIDGAVGLDDSKKQVSPQDQNQSNVGSTKASDRVPASFGFKKRLKRLTPIPDDQKALFQALIDDRQIQKQRFEDLLKTLESTKLDERDLPKISDSHSLFGIASSATAHPSVPSTQSTLPPKLHTRRHEIKDHARLIQNLTREVSTHQYQIDMGLRDRIQKSILRGHWEEWSPLAERYGHDTFIELFNQYDCVVKYWVDQMDEEALPLYESSAEQARKTTKPHTTKTAPSRTGRDTRDPRRMKRPSIPTNSSFEIRSDIQSFARITPANNHDDPSSPTILSPQHSHIRQYQAPRVPIQPLLNGHHNPTYNPTHYTPAARVDEPHNQSRVSDDQTSPAMLMNMERVRPKFEDDYAPSPVSKDGGNHSPTISISTHAHDPDASCWENGTSVCGPPIPTSEDRGRPSPAVDDFVGLMRAWTTLGGDELSMVL